MINDIESRRRRYFAAASRLALMDNRQMRGLLGEMSASGWGQTRTIEIESTPVFVKTIPVTALEYENLYSTANLYGLPTFYNYGVGSAGFGAFRELAAHVKTTNWVLDGSIPHFPLMYHHRIVPFDGPPGAPDPERHASYVKYWNSDAAIDRYIRERHRATHQIVICLEHFPHVLGGWLGDNLGRSGTVIAGLRHAAAFLQSQDAIHFDAHFGNILVDDDAVPYLADYGLWLDKAFTLTDEERAFFERNREYDDAQVSSGFGFYLWPLYAGLSPEAQATVRRQCGLVDDTGEVDYVRLVLDHLEDVHRGGLMNVDGAYYAEVLRQRDVIRLMMDFYSGLRGNDRKDTPYPDVEIRRLLAEARAQA